ncbi:MAG TPA: flagellar biosynthesis anti-sigma factor FlgM [Novosphingobium sp.]|nr:flagellar biosynthesis anti-sigma factor FlgM [Novosphingobium sp.]
MPPIEVGPARAIGAVGTRFSRETRGQAQAPAATGEPPVSTVVKSDALDPGAAPVDTDRVAEIRKAIEDGRYPIVPSKIADAMIAAGILLRSGE